MCNHHTSVTESVLRQEFLEYFNNYLTVEKFSEHRGLTIEQGKRIIETGRELHESYVKIMANNE